MGEHSSLPENSQISTNIDDQSPSNVSFNIIDAITIVLHT